MNFTQRELELLEHSIGLITESIVDEKTSFEYNKIYEKIKISLEYKLSTRMTPAKKRRCEELVKTASALILEYSGYSGDMGMINEYDRLKKEIGVICDSIGDVEGQLRADCEAAKRQLDVILDRIKDDLLAHEEAKSNAEAERKARVDTRYESAMEDYRVLCKYTNVIKNKFKALSDTRDDVRQSVSTARNSIIAEGYTK